MYRKSLVLFACLSFALALALTPLTAVAQNALVTVDVPGATETDCNDINTAGVVVGFYLDSAGANHGFYRAQGKLKKLNVPGSTATLAYGINDSKQIVGWYTDTTGFTHGFLYKGGAFATIDPPGFDTDKPLGHQQ